MNNPDITQYVVAELGKHHDLNDIIIEVCERSGMKWSDAQEFMQRVQSEHRSEITGRQNPLLRAMEHIKSWSRLEKVLLSIIILIVILLVAVFILPIILYILDSALMLSS